MLNVTLSVRPGLPFKAKLIITISIKLRLNDGKKKLLLKVRSSGGLPRKKRGRQAGDWMNEEKVDNVPLRPDGDTASPGQSTHGVFDRTSASRTTTLEQTNGPEDCGMSAMGEGLKFERQIEEFNTPTVIRGLETVEQKR
ncbi:hypothetical protein GQX74_013257 [Glossina fuscipes]|nr:hypothetical protein GQX74_013257 [Glossina fuscipes]